MKKFILFFALIGLIILGTKAQQTWNCGAQGNNLTATLSGSSPNYTLTISGSGDMANYLYNGTPWNSYKSQMKYLVIGDSVTSIGNNAFQLCTGFTGNLTIPNSITTIGNSAFDYCSSLTGSLTIPNSVTTIGAYAFYDCYGFNGTLTIGSLVGYIGNYAFNGCSSIDTITSHNLNPPTLGINVFHNVPQNIPIYVPCGKISNYKNAAGWNSFTNYYNDSIMIIAQGICGALGNNLTWQLLCEGTLIIKGSGAMANYTNGTAPWYNYKYQISKLIIGDSVTTIGQSAFYNCTALQCNLIIPNLVTSIGANAFYNCTYFTGTLTIPNSVITIGDYAFYQCYGFNGGLIIGNSVITIGIGAFAYCSGLIGNLNIPNSVTTIGINAFVICSGFNGNLIIPNSVITIGAHAFSYCSGFTGSLTIGNSVTTIGVNAFNCNGFTGSLTIGNSVTTIEEGAFSGCTNLTSLILPNSVTSIGTNAFWGCSGFEGNLIIPNSVITIGSSAFMYCGFSDLTIGNSVTTIGDVAFYYCTNLTSLILPNSVVTIGQQAFGYCIGLTAITVNRINPPTLGPITFIGVATTVPVYVPCGSIPNYQSSIDWNSFTNYQDTLSLPSPNGLTVAQQNATLKITWQNIAGVTNYEVYRDSVLLTTVITNTYIDNNVIDSTNYCYQIKTINGANCISQLSTAACKTFYSVKDASLSTLIVSTGTLTPIFNSSTYNYSVNVANSVNTILITAIPNHPQATLIGDGSKTLQVGVNQFIITVTAEDGITTQNYTVTINWDDIVGIDNYELGITNYELSVYPNPTNGLITIRTAVGVGFTADQNGAFIQIYDISGRVVQTQLIESQRNTNEFTIDISNLQQGMYYLRVGNETAKIIKN